MTSRRSAAALRRPVVSRPAIRRFAAGALSLTLLLTGCSAVDGTATGDSAAAALAVRTTGTSSSGSVTTSSLTESAPIISAPTTSLPTTSPPTTTSLPTTTLPNTSPPTTSPPTTVPPSTVPPTTVPPSTVPPTTVPPSTVLLSTAASPSEPATAATPASLPTAARSTRIAALPSAGLAGVNDPTCRSADRPVLLLHGTVSTPVSNFTGLAAALQSSGRCVYAVLYGAALGLGGVGPIRTSAAQVATFASTVLAVTGARQLDVVGYSQGGLVLRTLLAGDLDPALVATAVLIAPSFHGTTSLLTTALPAALCQACADQQAGSTLLTELARNGDLAGSVRYAVISTSRDTVATPVDSQVPAGPADRVRSVIVEQYCTTLRTDHVRLPAEAPVIGWVIAALTKDGRPEPADLGCAPG